MGIKFRQTCNKIDGYLSIQKGSKTFCTRSDDDNDDDISLTDNKPILLHQPSGSSKRGGFFK